MRTTMGSGAMNEIHMIVEPLYHERIVHADAEYVRERSQRGWVGAVGFWRCREDAMRWQRKHLNGCDVRKQRLDFSSRDCHDRAFVVVVV